MPMVHTCDRRARAPALAVALPTWLAAPAHDNHVAAARRTALGKARVLVEAARARVRPVQDRAAVLCDTRQSLSLLELGR